MRKHYFDKNKLLLWHYDDLKVTTDYTMILHHGLILLTVVICECLLLTLVSINVYFLVSLNYFVSIVESAACNWDQFASSRNRISRFLSNESNLKFTSFLLKILFQKRHKKFLLKMNIYKYYRHCGPKW